MENISIIIDDPDQDYVQALTSRIPFVDPLFAAEEAASALNRREERTALMILLLAEELDTSQQASGSDPDHLLRLTRDPDRAKQAGFLYRYERVSRLLQQIRRCCLEQMSCSAMYSTRLPPDQCRLILCFGLTGGCGTTAIALGIARELSRYRARNCLFLSWDAVESTLFCPEEVGADLDMALYRVLRQPEKQSAERFLPQTAVDGHGVTRFRPSSGFNLLYQLEETDRDAFLAALMKTSPWDCLVLDLGSELSDWKRGWMRCCHGLILIADARNISGGKSAKTERLIRETVLPAGTAQPVCIRNRVSPDLLFPEESEEKITSLPAGVNNGVERPVFWQRILSLETPEEKEKSREESLTSVQAQVLPVEIPEDPAAFPVRDGQMSLTLSGAFGIGIRETADRLMKGLQR